MTVSTVAPTGDPTFGPQTPFLYVTISSPVTASVNNVPSFEITLPTGVKAPNVFAAYFDADDPTAGWQTIGHMASSGSTLSFAPLFTLQEFYYVDQVYTFAFYRMATLPPPPLGTLFVANNQSSTVTEYQMGSDGDVSPTTTIAGGSTSLYVPTSVAIDSSGELYVDNDDNYVTVYGPGASGDIAAIRTLGGPNTGLQGAPAISVDSAGGLYAVNPRTYANDLTYFPAGSNGDPPPARTVVGPDTQLHSPESLGLDAQGLSYAVDVNNADITVYPYRSDGDTAPIRRIIFSQNNPPSSVAVDQFGGVYVLAAPYIFVYAPGAVYPYRKIGGPFSDVTTPNAIAVDGEGFIYVADTIDGILVFGPKGSPNVPVRVISGPSTGLNYPIGIAVTPYFTIP